ncbi:MAG TPA: GatB/YqeY domain-containing protein [Anaerolineales bacterium]|nr:GatB/YqeY domain-containing protein [Anaerolineales bacterium]
MSVKSELEKDLTTAMRNGDALRKRTIRLALSSINQVEIDQGHSLTEPEAHAILQKEVKARREAMEDAKRAGRQDLINESINEIEVLQVYLPQPLTTEEIEAMARTAIAETGANSGRDMGQVMKILLPRVQGRAESSQVSQIVRQLLG